MGTSVQPSLEPHTEPRKVLSARGAGVIELCAPPANTNEPERLTGGARPGPTTRLDSIVYLESLIAFLLVARRIPNFDFVTEPTGSRRAANRHGRGAKPRSF